MTPKLFLDRVLNGAAVGIVVGLIPNAITGEIWKLLMKLFPKVELFATLLHVVVGLQFTVPVIVGILIAMQFSMTAMQTVIVGTASFVGSGAMDFTPDGVMLVGIGDLINTMITAAVAVLIMSWIGNKLGSLTILFLPVLGGGLSGLIGILILPYIRYITTGIGALVNAIAEMQGLGIIASILIAALFANMIVSPISTVGVALAIGITGPASGAANLGIAAAAAVLAIGSLRVNNAGVTWSVFLGAMKMMMANYLKNPIMILPLSVVGAVTGLAGSFFGITGTPASAGFGHSGLVGPIAAAANMSGGIVVTIGVLALVYFVIPFAVAYGMQIVGNKTGLFPEKIYQFAVAGSQKAAGPADQDLDNESASSESTASTDQK